MLMKKTVFLKLMSEIISSVVNFDELIKDVPDNMHITVTTIGDYDGTVDRQQEKRNEINRNFKNENYVLIDKNDYLIIYNERHTHVVIFA